TAWFFTAGATATPAILLLVVTASGTAHGMMSPTIAACIGGLSLCTVGAIFGARRMAPLPLMHIPLALSLLLVTVAIADAGESKQALVELYALQTPLVIYCMGW